MNQQFKSIEYWNRILDIDPNNKVILTRAGDAYRTTGNYDKAREYYNKALNIDFDIYAAIGLALLCKGEGNYEEAATRFNRLINNDPKNSRLYVDLADCYISMNRKQDAITLLEDFVKLDNRNPAVRNMLERLTR